LREDLFTEQLREDIFTLQQHDRPLTTPLPRHSFSPRARASPRRRFARNG